MSLLAAPEPASMTIAGVRLEVGQPGGMAAVPLALACWLDDRRRRHWRIPQLVALAYRVATDDAALLGLLARRRAVPSKVLREAVVWATEQAVGRGFGESHVLASWICAEHRALRGRMILGGVRPEELPLVDLLDVAEHCLVERLGRDRYRKVVADAWESRDEWGTSTAAEAAQNAMMGL